MNTVYNVTQADLAAIAKFVFKLSEGQYSPIALVKILQKRLTDIEQDLLLRRAVDGATYKSIAEALGVSPSRIGSIMQKAIRKLNYAQTYEKSFLFSVVESERDRYKKLYEDLLTSIKERPGDKYMTTPIDVLELSVRSYNCLKRAGKDTLGKLAAMTEHDLLYVRNLGRKCIEEIKDKLAVVGLFLAPVAEWSLSDNIL